ncbi:hypothetical protein [Novosphingobium pokkalii]|jgi:hypothetical protein|uniref:Uncharacterized protein n=1 Tax=Novosphingobium pokkalii TaxID=1770194 RepID=A0ABV7V3A3_9SPHN|nr:hypothetical protein [Novosphingobium pokkalii]GHC94112.1 hypothetical protein GCM10019060_21830 [Novosphingobium pokkalii]
MLSLWLPRILLAFAVVFAARKGGEPEQSVAAILLATFALDVANHAIFGDPAWFAVNPGHLVIDLWAFIVLLWVAVRANRAWPLAVSAAQALVVLGHVAKLWELAMVRKAYWVMTQVPFSLQLLVLIFGTAAHMQRSRRLGDYHGWRLT